MLSSSLCAKILCFLCVSFLLCSKFSVVNAAPVTYKVSIVVGDVPDAQYPDSISVFIWGKNWVIMDDLAPAGGFVRGATQSLFLSADNDLGVLEELDLDIFPFGSDRNCFITQITISNFVTGTSTIFPVGKWLDDSHSSLQVFPQKNIVPTITYKYTLTVSTGAFSSTAYNDIQVKILGSLNTYGGSFTDLTSWQSLVTAEALTGSKDFSYSITTSLSLGTPTQLKIRFIPSFGSSSTIFVKKVTVYDVQSYLSYAFPYASSVTPTASGPTLNLFALVVSPPNVPGATLVQSTFVSNTDGWTLAGDPTSPTPIQTATGPSSSLGYIQGSDKKSANQIMYFNAPAKFLGDKLSAYDGTLLFQLNAGLCQTRTLSRCPSTLVNPIAVLTGKTATGVSTTLTFPTPYGIDFPNNGINAAWTPYSLLLNENAGWVNSAGISPSVADFKAILKSLSSLQILGEFLVQTSSPDVTLLASPTITQAPYSAMNSVLSGQTDIVAVVGINVQYGLSILDPLDQVPVSSSSPSLSVNVISDSTAGSVKLSSGTASLVSGNSYKVLWQPQVSGASYVWISDSKLSSMNGLLATYYDDAAFGVPKFYRVELNMYFDSAPAAVASSTWPGSPVFRPGTDNVFSVRLVGHIIPTTTETYTFYVTGYGGVSLLINGIQIATSTATASVPTEYSGTISLTANRPVQISLSLTSTGNSSPMLSLMWSSISVLKQVIPTSQLTYGYIKGSAVKQTVLPADTFTSACTAEGNAVNAGTAGQLMTFKIVARDPLGNYRQTGGDRFLVEIDGPDAVIPNIVDLNNGLGEYSVSYTAFIAGTYWVNITRSGQSIKGGLQVLVILPGAADPFKSYVIGSGATVGLFNELTTFNIITMDAYGNPLTVGGVPISVTFTRGASTLVTPQIVDLGNGVYTVKYTTSIAGLFLNNVLVNGKHINNGPFDLTIVSTASVDPSKTTVTGPGLAKSVVGLSSVITIAAKDTFSNPVSGAIFTIALTGAANIAGVIVDNGDGTYYGSYIPTVAGQYSLSITQTVGSTKTDVGGSYSVTAITSATDASTWWDLSFARRRQLVFSSTPSCSGVLYNFPMLITLNPTDWEPSIIGAVPITGQDIRFLEPGTDKELFHEIDSVSSSGIFYIWVQIPAYDANLSTDYVWMYYAYPSAKFGVASLTWDPSFLYVSHMNAATQSFVDSTAYGMTATKSSSSNPATAPGLIGLALNMRGGSTHDFISVDDVQALRVVKNLSISALVQLNSPSAGAGLVSRSVCDSNVNDYGLGITTSSYASFKHYSGSLKEYVSTTPVPQSKWTHVAVVADFSSSQTVYVYIDGVLAGTTSIVAGTTLTASHIPLIIGASGSGTCPNSSFFNGLIDELRIYNTARNSCWIRAEQKSMASAIAVFQPVDKAYGPKSLLASLIPLSTSKAGVQTAVKVNAVNKWGFAKTVGGDNVIFSLSPSSDFSSSSLTDNLDGTYTIKFTPKKSGNTAKLSVQIDGGNIISSPFTVIVAVGDVDPSKSVVGGNGLNDGVAGQTRTVSLTTYDSFGNKIPFSKATPFIAKIAHATTTVKGTDLSSTALKKKSTNTYVAIAVTNSFAILPDDNGDGTYTFTYNQQTATAATTISFSTSDGTVASAPSTYKISPAAASASISSATFKKTSWSSGDVLSYDITLKDTYGNIRSSGGERSIIGGSIALLAADGSISSLVSGSLTEVGNGVYTVSAGSTAGGQYGAVFTISGVQSTPFATTNVISSEADAGTSTVISYDATVMAGAFGTIVVQGKDKFNGPVVGGGTRWLVVCDGASNIDVTNIVDNKDSTYKISYKTTQPGTYLFNIYLKNTIINSGTKYVVVTAAKTSAALSYATGPALTSGKEGYITTATVQAVDIYGNKQTTGGDTVSTTLNPIDSSEAVYNSVVDNKDGTYTVGYIAGKPGKHTLNISVDTGAILSSPFSPNIINLATMPSSCFASNDASKTWIASTATAAAGSSYSFTIYSISELGVQRTVGGDSYKVVATCSACANTPSYTGSVVDNNNGSYTATVTTLNGVGLYDVVVTISAGGVDTPINRSPYPFTATPGVAAKAKFTASGTGTTKSTVGVSAPVIVQANDAHNNVVKSSSEPVSYALTKNGDSTATVTGNCNNNSDGTYSCNYISKRSGSNTLTLSIGSSSPATLTFTVTVGAGATDPSKSTLSGTGLTSATAGVSAQVVITTFDSQGNKRTLGGDKFIVSVSPQATSVTGVFATVTDNSDGTYLAAYIALVAGDYNLDAKLGTVVVDKRYTPSVVAADIDAPSTFVKSTVGNKAGTPSVIILKARDKFKNDIKKGGSSFSCSATKSGVSPVAGTSNDNNDGTHTVSFPTTITGSYVPSCSVGGSNTGSMPAFTVSPSSAAAAQSIALAILPQTGTQWQTLTAGKAGTFLVQSKDVYGNIIVLGGNPYLVFKKSGAGAFAVSIVDNLDGTYTVTQSSKIAGSYLVGVYLCTGQCYGSSIGSGSNYLYSDIKDGPFPIKVVPDVSSAANCVASGTGISTASQFVKSSFVVTVMDQYDNPVGVGGELSKLTGTVSQGSTTINVSFVTDNNDGTYTAEYTPTKDGTWSLSVKFAGVSIKSSAFTVTVTRAVSVASKCIVSGLSSSWKAGTSTSFSIKMKTTITSGSTSTDYDMTSGLISEMNQLVVKVLGADGSVRISCDPTTPSAACTISDPATGSYTVTFKSTIAENIKVSVALGATGVLNNPFNAIIVPNDFDCSKTTVSGGGTVGSTTDANGEVVVSLTDAYGNLLGAGGKTITMTVVDGSSASYIPQSGPTVSDRNDGTYGVVFQITTVGSYSWSVSVSGCPSTNNISKSITVAAGKNSPKSSTIDGNLVIVAGKQSTFVVVNRDQFGNYRTSTDAVTVSLYSSADSGSTWASGALSTSSGKSTYTFSQTLAGNNYRVYAEIRVGNPASGEESCSSTACPVKGCSTGPRSGITYTIIPDVTNKVSDFKSIELSGNAGDLRSLVIQAKDQYGNIISTGGDLFTVSIARPDATTFSATVVDNRDGTYTSTYTPTVAGTYVVTASLSGSALTVGSKNVVIGPAVFNLPTTAATVSSSVIAGNPIFISIQTKDKYSNNLTSGGNGAFIVKLLDESKAVVQTLTATDNSNGSYSASFSQNTVGTYTVTITKGTDSVASSPYSVTVVAASIECLKTRIGGGGFTGTITDARGTISVTAVDNFLNARVLPSGTLVATMVSKSGSCTNCPSTVSDITVSSQGVGAFVVSYKATVIGTYTITLTLGSCSNNVFDVNVSSGATDPLHSFASITSATQITAGVSNSITVTAADKFGNPVPWGGETVAAVFTQPSGGKVSGSVVDAGSGKYTITYTLTEKGNASVAISLTPKSGTVGAIAGSPITIIVLPAATNALKSVVKSITPSNLSSVAGVEVIVVVQTQDQYGNTRVSNVASDFSNWTSTVSLGTVSAVTTIVDNNDGTYTVKYTPTIIGAYDVNILFNGVKIDNQKTPNHRMTVTPAATNTPKCIANGGGVLQSVAGVEATLTITAKDQFGNPRGVGGDAFVVTIFKGSTDKSSVITAHQDNNDGTYTTKYKIPSGISGDGTYTINILRAGSNIQDSPFSVESLTPIPPCESSVASASVDFQGIKYTPSGGSLTGTIQALAGTFSNVIVTLKKSDGSVLACPTVAVVATVTPSGGSAVSVPTVLKQASDKSLAYVVSLTATSDPITVATTYTIRIQYQRQTLLDTFSATGSDFSLIVSPNVIHPAMSVAFEASSQFGLTQGSAEELLTFSVKAHDVYSNPLTSGGSSFSLTFATSGSADVKPTPGLTDNNDGTYLITYTVVIPATYTVTIDVIGGTGMVTGKTFNVVIIPSVTNAALSTAAPSSPVLSGSSQTFNIQAVSIFSHVRQKGGDTFVAEVVSTVGKGTTISVKDNGNGIYVASYVPTFIGSWSIAVSLVSNGQNLPIKNSPFSVAVNPGRADALHCKSSPSTTAVNGVKSTVLVTVFDPYDNIISTGTPAEDWVVTGVEKVASNPATFTGTVSNNNDGTYTVSYTPTSGGYFDLSIKLKDVHYSNTPTDIINSPFSVSVYASSSDAGRTIAYCPVGTDSTRCGVGIATASVVATFSIQVRDIKGIQKISGGDILDFSVIRLSDNLAIDNSFKSIGPITSNSHDYPVTFTADSPGIYAVNIKLGGVPLGTQYQVLVMASAASAANYVASGDGISFFYTKIPQTFTVQAKDSHGNLRTTGGDNIQASVNLMKQVTIVQSIRDSNADGTGKKATFHTKNVQVWQIDAVLPATVVDLNNGQYTVTYQIDSLDTRVVWIPVTLSLPNGLCVLPLCDPSETPGIDISGSPFKPTGSQPGPAEASHTTLTEFPSSPSACVNNCFFVALNDAVGRPVVTETNAVSATFAPAAKSVFVTKVSTGKYKVCFTITQAQQQVSMSLTVNDVLIPSTPIIMTTVPGPYSSLSSLITFPASVTKVTEIFIVGVQPFDACSNRITASCESNNLKLKFFDSVVSEDMICKWAQTVDFNCECSTSATIQGSFSSQLISDKDSNNTPISPSQTNSKLVVTFMPGSTPKANSEVVLPPKPIVGVGKSDATNLIQAGNSGKFKIDLRAMFGELADEVADFFDGSRRLAATTTSGQAMTIADMIRSLMDEVIGVVTGPNNYREELKGAKRDVDFLENSFSLTTAGEYKLNLILYDEDLPDSPFIITVVPGPISASNTVILPLTSNYLTSQKDFTINIQARDMHRNNLELGGSKFTVEWVKSSPSDTNDPGLTLVKSNDLGNGVYEVTFKACKAGTFKISTLLADTTPPVNIAFQPSEYVVVGGDPDLSKTKIYCCTSSAQSIQNAARRACALSPSTISVDNISYFTMEFIDSCGNTVVGYRVDQIVVTLTSTTDSTDVTSLPPSSIVGNGSGMYDIGVSTTKIGSYTLGIRVQGEKFPPNLNIPGKTGPIVLKFSSGVPYIQYSLAYGEGLQSCRANVTSTFNVQLMDRYKNKVDYDAGIVSARIDVGKWHVLPSCIYVSQGLYTCTYKTDVPEKGGGEYPHIIRVVGKARNGRRLLVAGSEPVGTSIPPCDPLCMVGMSVPAFTAQNAGGTAVDAGGKKVTNFVDNIPSAVPPPAPTSAAVAAPSLAPAASGGGGGIGMAAAGAGVAIAAVVGIILFIYIRKRRSPTVAAKDIDVEYFEEDDELLVAEECNSSDQTAAAPEQASLLSSLKTPSVYVMKTGTLSSQGSSDQANFVGSPLFSPNRPLMQEGNFSSSDQPASAIFNGNQPKRPAVPMFMKQGTVTSGSGSSNAEYTKILQAQQAASSPVAPANIALHQLQLAAEQSQVKVQQQAVLQQQLSKKAEVVAMQGVVSSNSSELASYTTIELVPIAAAVVDMGTCWVCGKKDNCKDLITPCSCQEDFKFTHEKCLKDWTSSMSNSKSCVVCGQAYNSTRAVSATGTLIDITSPVAGVSKNAPRRPQGSMSMATMSQVNANSSSAALTVEERKALAIAAIQAGQPIEETEAKLLKDDHNPIVNKAIILSKDTSVSAGKAVASDARVEARSDARSTYSDAATVSSNVASSKATFAAGESISSAGVAEPIADPLAEPVAEAARGGRSAARRPSGGSSLASTSSRNVTSSSASLTVEERKAAAIEAIIAGEPIDAEDARLLEESGNAIVQKAKIRRPTGAMMKGTSSAGATGSSASYNHEGHADVSHPSNHVVAKEDVKMADGGIRLAGETVAQYRARRHHEKADLDGLLAKEHGKEDFGTHILRGSGSKGNLVHDTKESDSPAFSQVRLRKASSSGKDLDVIKSAAEPEREVPEWLRKRQEGKASTGSTAKSTTASATPSKSPATSRRSTVEKEQPEWLRKKTGGK